MSPAGEAGLPINPHSSHQLIPNYTHLGSLSPGVGGNPKEKYGEHSDPSLPPSAQCATLTWKENWVEWAGSLN